jgi:parallel beta-helix repeat protein
MVYYNSNFNIIAKNTLNNCSKPGLYYVAAIKVLDAHYNIIAENNITNCSDYGIYLDDSTYNKVTDNIIANTTRATSTGYGIYATSSTSNSIIWGNTLISNEYAHARDDGSSNQWDNGSQGNYWDDYTGMDNDGNGIGDTPYYTGGIIDSYPLIYPSYFGLPPIIAILSPLADVYSTNNIWTNLTGNAMHYWYSLEGPSGHGNISWTENVQETGLTDGTYTLHVYGNSTTGLVRSVSVEFTIDTTSPLVSILSPLNTAYTNGTVTISLSGDATHYWYFIENVDSINQTWVGSVGRTLPDGIYVLHAYGNDSAGNEGWMTVIFTIDTTSPVVTIQSPMSITYTSGTITISLSGDAAQYWYFIEGADATNQTWIDISERFLIDGTYTLNAYGRDSAGNEAGTAVTFTIDTMGPNVTITSPQNRTYTANIITISLSGDAVCYWYRISGVDTTDQPWTADINRVLADGTYALYASGNDSVGNQNSSWVSFTVDTTGPTVTIENPTSGAHTSGTVTVTLSGDAAHYWYFIENIDSVNQTWGGSITRALPDGTYTLHAYGNDSVGNEAWTILTFTIDTTPPIVTILNPLNITLTTNTITISLSGNAANYWYQIAPVDTTDQPWATDVNRVLPDGVYSVFAYGNDSAGNVNSALVFFTIDTTGPTVAIISPANTTYTSATITIALSGDATHYWYFIAGIDVTNQSWTISVSRTLADGTYTLYAYGNDTVGNENGTGVAFTIDTTGPTVSITSPTSLTYPTNTLTIALAGDATHYWYYIEGVDGANQSWTTSVSRTLADGTYTLIAYGNDSVGNENSSVVTFAVDTIEPTIFIASPGNVTLTTNTVTISFSGDADYYWYFIEGVDLANQSWASNAVRALPDGTYTLNAYGNDSVGNVGSALVTFSIDTTPPTVTIISPTNTTYANNTIIVALSGDAAHYWFFIEGVDATNHSWTNTISRQLIDGAYILHAFGNDSIGLQTATSVIFSVDMAQAISDSLEYLANQTELLLGPQGENVSPGLLDKLMQEILRTIVLIEQEEDAKALENLLTYLDILGKKRGTAISYEAAEELISAGLSSFGLIDLVMDDNIAFINLIEAIFAATDEQGTFIGDALREDLIDKVRLAIDSLESGDNDRAVNVMLSFIDKVSDKRGSKISEADAAELITLAEEIIGQIDS